MASVRCFLRWEKLKAGRRGEKLTFPEAIPPPIAESWAHGDGSGFWLDLRGEDSTSDISASPSY